MRAQTTAKAGRLLASASSLGVLLLLGACGGGGGGGGDNDMPVPLGDANAVMSALSGKVNGNTVPDAQVPSVNANDPKVQSAAADAPALNGDTVSLPVSVQTGSALAALYAKIPGATSGWFQVQPPPPPAGKSLDTSKTSVTIAFAVQIVNFQVTVPNLDTTGTDGKLCFEFRVETEDGTVTGSAEGEQACIGVVGSRPTAATNDQPSSAELADTLAGNWFTPCVDISDVNVDTDNDGVDDTTFRAFVSNLAFEAANYSQSFRLHKTDDCTDTPSETVPFEGTYTSDDAALDPQSNTWQREIDFNPDNANLGNCFNRLRTEGAPTPTTLLLGYPLTFSRLPSEYCGSDETRPDRLLTAFPFTRG